MILAVLLGVILATGEASPALAAAVIAISMIARSVIEIVVPVSVLSGALSPYSIYRENLKASGVLQFGLGSDVSFNLACSTSP